VDDLFMTSKNEDHLLALCAALKAVYPETTSHGGKKLDYLGMTFDFTVDGEVSITMHEFVERLLEECGVTHTAASPAGENLFEVRDEADAHKLGDEDKAYFHSHTAKLLYLGKRTRPEILTAVSFLATRVHTSDTDDMAKLKRVVAYVRGTKERGVTLCIGGDMSVGVQIDAAYGVHTNTGRSHSGAMIVIGGATVYAKSTAQKNVTKSSTEAELVATSDNVAQAIHLRNFVIEQGYDLGPLILYQDNLSCMALMKRGGPSSDRSRHINIRFFWISERIAMGEVRPVHLGTKQMWVNVLTKPVQGAQFRVERAGLTGWRDHAQ
jgi:hypothetical protein